MFPERNGERRNLKEGPNVEIVPASITSCHSIDFLCLICMRHVSAALHLKTLLHSACTFHVFQVCQTLLSL